MPPLEPGEHMLEAFIDMGLVMHLPDGDAPLTWAEAQAYATSTLTVSDPWEIRTLVRMSLAFWSTREAAKNPLYIAPIEQGLPEDD